MTELDPMDVALGKAIARALTRARISQPKLARKLPDNDKGEPRNTSTISRWLKGELRPHQRDLEVIAALNGETADDLRAQAVVILAADATRRALAEYQRGPQDTS